MIQKKNMPDDADKAKRTIGIIKKVARDKNNKNNDNTFQPEPVLSSVVTRENYNKG